MALTVDELKMLLGSEEPNYTEIAAKAGNDSAPAVAEVAKDKDVMLASKATYLASLLPGDIALKVVETAAKSKNQLLSLAAASGLVNLPETNRNKLAEKMIAQDDVSVQKLVLRAVQGKVSVKLKQSIDSLSTGSASELIRTLSKTTLSKIK